MKSIRKSLVLILAVLTVFGAVMPAYADELDNEDELIQAALAEQEDLEESLEPTDEQVDEETDEETEEAEPVSPLDGGSGQAFVWQTPGGADVDILSGGTMLTDGGALYFAENGIRCLVGGEERTLTEETGKNLNLSDGWLYYTTDSAVRRVSLADGTVETVYDCGDIEQLYVIGRWLMYLKDGGVYTYDCTAQTLAQLDAPENVTGLIPTQYGNLYLTGGAFDRSVWVNGEVAFAGVASCYTDSGYLVINRSGTYQIALDALFDGARTLDDYNLHQNEISVPELTEAEALAAEAAYFESEEYAALEALGEPDDGIALMAFDGEGSTSVYVTAQQLALSGSGSYAIGDNNAYNITRRARQHAEILWTPLKDVYGWGGSYASRKVKSKQGTETNYFKAGETYQGIPYSQAVWSNGYVGNQLSLTEFMGYVSNSESKLYTDYSSYGAVAPYYGSDCASFVSAAWELPQRCSCPTLTNYSTYIGSNLNLIQLGDCLNKTTSHVVLITDIAYDYNGNIVSVEITEQTPLKMKVTNYGEKIQGKTNPEIVYVSSLSYIYEYYLNNGYYIYRRSWTGNVSYTAEAASPLEDDGWLSTPMLKMEANSDGTAILVSLSHLDDADVYYTTDGSPATTGATKYTDKLEIKSETTIHAIADYTDVAKGAFELIYTIDAEKADAPVLECQSGALDGTTVSSGSVISFSSCEGATIYYTTDGTEPTTASSKLDASGITVTQDMTVRAFALAQNRLRSDEVKLNITVGTFYEVKTSVTGVGTITPSNTVRVREGQSQTFTIAAGTNYKISDVLVDGSSVGAVSSYTLSDVRKNHSIEAKFIIDLPFTDVKATSWYANEVAYAYTKGYLKGITATAFCPNQNMTRGQFATILGRYAGAGSQLENLSSGSIAYTATFSINVRQSASTSSSVVSFISDKDTFVKVNGSTTDAAGALWYKVEVNGKSGYIKANYNGEALLNVYDGAFKDIAGQYYNGYVQWAYYNKLINGMATTAFGSQYNISRQDICVVLYRYLTSYCGKSLSAGSKTFTDEGEIKDYAKTAVHALANIGVVNGYDDGSFLPTEYATRAEVATMFMRLDNYLNG